MCDRTEIHPPNCAQTPSGVGGCRVTPPAKWFIAIVNNRSEKVTADKLDRLGIENYVPIQTVYRLWKNGRKAKVDKVVIPSVIFIHCTENHRREIVNLPFIYRFMTNKAGISAKSTHKPIATVSEDEINQLRFMLGQSDIPVEVTERSYTKGDKVRIIRGSLAGLEGEVADMNAARSELTINLEYFGCAKLIIDTINLEPISN